MDGSNFTNVVQGIFAPLEMPRAVYPTQILRIALSLLSRKQANCDDGRVFTHEVVDCFHGRAEAIVTDPIDGQRYRVTVEPFSPETPKKAAAA